jgi:hypothetical protein
MFSTEYIFIPCHILKDLLAIEKLLLWIMVPCTCIYTSYFLYTQVYKVYAQ